MCCARLRLISLCIRSLISARRYPVHKTSQGVRNQVHDLDQTTQAVLPVKWTHTSFCLFCHEAAKMYLCPEVINHCSCSTQLSMQFIMLINVPMSITVDILTFFWRINTTSIRIKQGKSLCFFHYFSFMSSYNFMLS